MQLRQDRPDIFKTEYFISFEGENLCLVKIEQFVQNEIKNIYMTKISSQPSKFYFEFTGYIEKIPSLNGEIHHITKELYEMAYNIAIIISDGISVNEKLLFNGGVSKYNGEDYAIQRYQTNDVGALYYEKREGTWVLIGENYAGEVFKYFENPIKVDNLNEKELIYILDI